MGFVEVVVESAGVYWRLVHWYGVECIFVFLGFLGGGDGWTGHYAGGCGGGGRDG